MPYPPCTMHPSKTAATLPNPPLGSKPGQIVQDPSMVRLIPVGTLKPRRDLLFLLNPRSCRKFMPAVFNQGPG